ncbi:kinase, partial [Thraustotheca clavata]
MLSILPVLRERCQAEDSSVPLHAFVALILSAASTAAYQQPRQQIVGDNIHEDYELSNEIIGEGGFCVVRKGKNKKTGEFVAVKEMSKQMTSSKHGDRDFWAEVDMLRIAGTHENIMSLRGVYESQTSWYIVQELATGGELFDHLVANGAYSEKMASNALRDLCQAMYHLHRKGIVHGDVKPENIMLRGDHLCLVDFGVSYRIGERSSDLPIVGTPAYCAPEAFLKKDHSSLGPQSDMFALGIVLYILLCGCHPFDTYNTLTDQEISRRIVRGQFNTQSRAWRRVSKDAQDLIRKLLCVDPTKRLTAIEALQHSWLTSDKVSAIPMPKSAINLKRFQRGRRRLRASILAVLLQAPTQSTEDNLEPSPQLVRGVSSNPETAAEKAAMVASTLSVFDQDGKGYISDADLRRVAAQLGKKLSDNDIREMLTAATGDPEISTPKKLSYDDVKLAICSLRSAVYNKDDVISNEGDVDHHFYVLMEGQVKVTCANPIVANSSPLPLRTLDSGDYFGVMELLAPDGKIHPRISSYECSSSTCKVLKLLKEDFASVSGVYKMLDDFFQSHAQDQAHVQMIKSIEDAHGKIQHVMFSAGDFVYKEGDKRDSYYIIAEGSVDVIMNGVVVETLTEGDYFPLSVSGEANVIRRANVQCRTDTVLVEIKGDVFRNFLSSYRFLTAYFQDQAKQRNFVI